VFASLAPAALLLGCSESAEQAQSSTKPSTPAWVLTAAPEGAVSVLEAKASAKEGDEIVLRGRIGGGAEPVSAESSVIRIVDAGLFNQCTVEDDHCPTPWDYCCASSEELVGHSATVQLVDGSGNPITQSPTAHGFVGLDEVIVRGTVGARPNDEVLVVRATGIYRKGG